MSSNYQTVLDIIAEEVRPYFGKGRVAHYIPALAEVDPTRFGMAVAAVDGTEFSIGDAAAPFS
ncbi:glutaminase, partial [Streptomyces turgidiscabies]|uniref:glutaminase n=1 Tax=Streptomyces turgidiscabies TaxID=85558 RepID=UPI0038F77816